MIKNIDIPSCRNCIHYKPSFYSDYASISSTCEYFGTKDIRTNIITYDYADQSRSNEEKCGLEGKYFTQDPNVEFKIFLHSIGKNAPLSFYLTMIICSNIYNNIKNE
jgi:hypothetical protein